MVIHTDTETYRDTRGPRHTQRCIHRHGIIDTQTHRHSYRDIDKHKRYSSLYTQAHTGS
jgi:hypothetical protein